MATPMNKFWPRLRELSCEGLSRDDNDDYSTPNNPPLPLSPLELAKIERKLGIPLPSDYRQFLLEVGGVLFHSTNVSPIQVREAFGDIEHVECLFGSEKEKGSLLENIETMQGRIPETLIPIGQDPYGNLHCQGIGGDEAGKIYFWDHEGPGEE